MTKHAPLRLKRLPIPAALARGFATASLLLPGLALAGGGPSGGVVVGGHATISNPAPNGTVITETSNSAIINWQQFNIGSGDYVQFIQPSSSSVVLNRIIGGSPSQILGDLSANGRVFLINPNGVLFGKGAQLDVGGLVASTMNIANSDFLAGHYVFSGGSAPGSSIVNAGTIKTSDGGFVVLAGDYVHNTGVIQARLGQVVLASGAATTLDLDGSGLVSFAVDKATLAQKAGVDNAGQIIADGGRVIMTAQTAHDLVGSAVNNSGLVRAQGIASHNGEIELTASGGDITDSGTLDVSSSGGSGGTVKIDADRNIDIQQGAQILASGSQGGTVSIIADGTLNTRAGSLIDAHGSAGPGGYTELSGHGALTIRGDLTLGHGGTLLIDPTNLTIASGTGTSNSATVFESTIATTLQGGSNVQLVASNSITLASLANNTLNGRSGNQSGGSLLLGIGTISGGTYTEGSGGTISFADAKNIIAVDGGLTIDAGSASGTVNVGSLIGGFVNVKGVDGITTRDIATTGFTPSTGNPTVDNGAITLTASNGSISTGPGTLTTGVSTPCSVSCPTTAIGSVTVSAGGGVQLGDITTVATALGTTGSSVADASVTINGNSANLGGDVGIGSITTVASTVKGTGNAYVAIADNNSGAQSGTLSVGGITTLLSESPQSGDVHVTLSNSNGAVDLSGFTISTDGSAATSLLSGDVTLSASGGGAINVSEITATNSAINASTLGGGNITLGELSPGTSSTDEFSTIDLESSGALALGGTSTSLTAGSITLSAGSGNLSFGALAATNGAIKLTASGGNVQLNGSDTTTGSGTIGITASGDITYTNNVSAGGDLTFNAGGQVSDNNAGNALSAAGFANITGASTVLYTVTGGTGISLTATGGNAGFTALTATDGDVGVTDTGGSINGSSLTASSGSIKLTGDQGINVGAASAGSGFSATNNSGSVVLGSLSAGESGIYIINSSGNITLNGNGASTSAGGGISVSATEGGITYTNNISASGNLQFNASGTISDNNAGNALSGGNVSVTGGSLSLYNVTSASGVGLTATAGDLLDNGTITTNSAIELDDTGGNINASSLTAVNSSISVNTYSGNGSGNITLGSVSGGSGPTDELSYVNINALGSLTATSSNIVAGSIGIGTGAGLLSIGNLTATNGTLTLTNSGGSIQTGNLSASSSSSEGASATISVYAAGGVSVGSVTTNAQTGSGSASAYIQIEANSSHNISTQLGGNLVVGGPISTNAFTNGEEGVANANVELDNGKGSISTGGNTISTAAKATVGSVEADITLAATAGDITTAGLSVISGGSIGVSTTGSGNISVGQLSSTSGSLSNVSLTSAGSLSTNGTDITTGALALSAANGDLDSGNLTTTLYGINLSDAGGNMTLGNVLSAGGIELTNSNGGINTGSLTSVDNIFITSTGSGGSIKTGPLAAVSGTLGTVDISASGGLTVGGTSVTAGVITLSAADGDLTAGNLTGTYGTVTVSDANGDIALGNVSGDAPVSITNSNGGIGTGNIAAVDGSSITVTAAGSGGNIKIGTLSGGGPLDLVDLAAAGTLTTGDSSFSAGAITLSAGAGGLNLGTLTASSGALTVSDSAGNISTGALSAGSNVTLSAAGGTVKVGGPISLGNAGNGALTISATGVQTGDITNNSPLAAVGSGNDMSITASNGNINIGNVGTAGTGTVALTLSAAAGSINAGSINLEALNAQASGDVDVGTLTLNSLTPGSASNLVSTTGGVTAGPVTSNHGLDVSAQTGISLGAVSVVNGLQVASAGGTISTGNLADSGAGVAVISGGSTVTVGNVSADGDVQIGSIHGGVSTGNLATSSGTLTLLSNGALTVGKVSASSITAVTNGANAKYGDLSSSGMINLTVNGGNLSTGDISGSQVFTTLDTGNEQVGNVTVTGNNFFFSMGDIAGQTLSIGSLNFAGTATATFGFTNTSFSIGSVNVGGGFVANLGNGSLSTGNIVAGSGAINLSDSHSTITAGNLSASTGAVSVTDGGNNVILGNILASGAVTVQGSGTVALNRSISGQSVSLSASHGISDGGALTVTASGGDLSLASALSADGNISLSAANGALTFGNLNGANIALSSGQALNLSGNNINASGNFSLAVGGNTNIANSSINADGSAAITSGGTLGIANSSVTAQTVTLNASGGITVNNGSVIGASSQGGFVTGPQSHFVSNSSVSLTSGGDISIDKSMLNASQLTLNGDNIQIANGTALNGANVVLTGTGAVDASGSSSSINAGALSVRGGSINLADAVLTVGSGSAAFGSDAALLAAIHAKSPTLVVPAHGPNASFSAAGGVTLGKLSIAGGYLFIQAPTLQLPAALSGSSNMFVDFLPSNPAALLNVNLTQPLNGITTLVFGGSPQTGNIQIGDGSQNFAIASNTNLVFATSGATLYPDSISSNGQVVVLGDSVFRTDLTDIPLTTDQYTIDEPDSGALAYSGDQGDINDPGVNNANKGRIDIRTSTQQTLSCGIGGTQ